MGTHFHELAPEGDVDQHVAARAWVNNKGVTVNVAALASELRDRQRHIPALADKIDAIPDEIILSCYLCDLSKNEPLFPESALTGVLDNIVSADDFVAASTYLRSVPFKERVRLCRTANWRASWLVNRVLDGGAIPRHAKRGR